MLPGFRFLFAAIVLSTSILIFGLGAAALLRAAHEEFASNPSWHPAPETTFAQQAEAARPVLAMLRVEPPAAEPKASDNVAAVAAPVAQTPMVSAPAEPEQIAALKPQEASPPQAAKPESAVSETPPQGDVAAARPDPPAAADTAKATPPEAEAKVASSEPVLPPTQVLPPANDAGPAASEPAATEPAASGAVRAPALPETDTASTKIATLGGPPVTIGPPPPAKAVSVCSTQSATAGGGAQPLSIGVCARQSAPTSRATARRTRYRQPQVLLQPQASPARRRAPPGAAQ
jgi:hypothetical protein